ncbi:site-specific integrase [Nocardia sp. NPDC047654]|uniref:site-specific integrase n=1 Tax=Nocardia sp. NPDC047654 TaxID=3364314 RepID=UPI00371B906D
MRGCPCVKVNLGPTHSPHPATNHQPVNNRHDDQTCAGSVAERRTFARDSGIAAEGRCLRTIRRLRHTGLTWSADAGVPLHRLQKIAGHRDPRITERYLHPDIKSSQDYGRLLSQHLRSHGVPNSAWSANEESPSDAGQRGFLVCRGWWSCRSPQRLSVVPCGWHRCRE